MSDTPSLADLRRSVEVAQAALRREVLRTCPDHAPRQHRDSRAPWCRICGRDWAGNQLRDGAPA